MFRSVLIFMVSFIFTTACVVSASNPHYNQQEDVVYHQAHGVALVEPQWARRRGGRQRWLVIRSREDSRSQSRGALRGVVWTGLSCVCNPAGICQSFLCSRHEVSYRGRNSMGETSCQRLCHQFEHPCFVWCVCWRALGQFGRSH